jgi:formylglycine-generating enzyme required for sulfatase activity
LRTLRDDVPAELDRICLKCLEKDPADRYPTAADLAHDLRRCLKPPHARPYWALAVVAGVLLGSLLLRWLLPGPAPASVQALPGVGPPPAEPDRKPLKVQINTNPDGAQVVVYPLDTEYRTPVFAKRQVLEGVTPLTATLDRGDYLVVAWLEDGRFHEVYRRVPRNVNDLPLQWPHKSWMNFPAQARVGAQIQWPVVNIPGLGVAEGMAQFSGNPRFRVGIEDDDLVPAHLRHLPAYYLDPREITIDEFKTVNAGAFPPGPGVSMNRTKPGDYAVTGVWFDEAVAWAEKAGKRLPTEFEYEYAATSGGTTTFPWGADPGLFKTWTYKASGFPEEDRTGTEPPIHGLFSNVAEWTDSQFGTYPLYLKMRVGTPIGSESANLSVVRGGDFSVANRTPGTKVWTDFGPRMRFGHDRMTALPGLGFRCARSARPRLAEIDFERPLE